MMNSLEDKKLDLIKEKGLVLLGCGKMGAALLRGWIRKKIPLHAIEVHEPRPQSWLTELSESGISLNPETVNSNAAAAVIAVKPQIFAQAAPILLPAAENDAVVLSIAAGQSIGAMQEIFGKEAKIVRAMPNLPASIGAGVSAYIGSKAAGDDALALVDALLSAIGVAVKIDREADMNAVTAVSGSGPAYLFLLVEAMAAAGQSQGLSRELADRLARDTAEGAGALLRDSPESVSELRAAVTSEGGTTEAALSVLMDKNDGLHPLMRRALQAAYRRSLELSG